jgi:hypothetical protein
MDKIYEKNYKWIKFMKNFINGQKLSIICSRDSFVCQYTIVRVK